MSIENYRDSQAAGALLAGGLGAQRIDGGTQFPAWSQEHASMAQFVAAQDIRIKELETQLAAQASRPAAVDTVLPGKVQALLTYWSQWRTTNSAIEMFCQHLEKLLVEHPAQ